MSIEVESKTLGLWHHPKIGKGKDGRAIFLPTMEYGKLLKDSNFKMWLDHYRGSSSKSSAKVTVYRLMKAGDLPSPSAFLDLSTTEAKKLIRSIVNDSMNKGQMQGARIAMCFGTNFYNYHHEDKEIKFRRFERVQVTSKKILNETIPHNSDVYRLADVALGLKYKDNQKNKLLGLRNQAILLFLWESGVRVNALCKLRYKDIKDYVEGRISFQQLGQEFKEANIEYWENLGLKMNELPPLFLKVSPQLDTKIGSYGLSYYVTFLHQSGFDALKQWLETRVQATGKPLKPADYVFVGYDFSANTIGEKPLNPHLINHMLKTVAGRAGLNGERIWVHVLRKAFRKVLRENTSMDDETREALMGHKLRGSQGNYFDYHDILAIAKNYMACDWTRGNVSKVANLTNKVEDQAETIKKLSQELEQYRTQSENKERQLEERIRTQVQESFNKIIHQYGLEKAHVEYNKQYQIKEKKEEQP